MKTRVKAQLPRVPRAWRLVAGALILAGAQAACIQREPADPQAELFRAAGVILTGEARLDTELDLRREWVRGCETRVGNVAADAFARGAGADIGLAAGGNIRDDRGITKLSVGTVTASDLKLVLPFNGQIYKVEMTAYRLKQGLEAGVGRLGTSLSAAATSDLDGDGRQHGDCYYMGQSGNGRFLQVSSRLKVEINPNNQTQVTSGAAGDNTLVVSTPGRKITKILIDDVAIYSNAAGLFATGWVGGGNCSVTAGFHNGTVFTGSAACNLYTVALPDFQAQGNDDHPTFSPSLAEVNNDGSVTTLSTAAGIDADLLLSHLQFLASTSLTGVKPKIEDRITFSP